MRYKYGGKAFKWLPERLLRPLSPSRSPYAWKVSEQQALESEVNSLARWGAADSTTIGNLLQRCTEPESLESGRKIHEEIIRSGKSGDRFIQNLLIQMYGKCASLDEARKVFDSITEKNVFSWNIMIGAYVQNGLHSEAYEIYKRMTSTPSAVTFVSVLEACYNIGCLVEVNAVHTRIAELKLETNPVVATALINAFSKCGSLLSAVEVFQNVPLKDAVCWTCMISGYAHNGDGRGAVKTFQRMTLEGISPDMISITSVISACTLLRSFQDGHRLYKSVIRCLPFFYDAQVSAALVNMYSKCGQLLEAWKVFDRTYKDDVVLWNSMITAYAENGENEKALTLYREGMRKEFGMKPDAVTFITLLEACTNMKDLKQGTMIHKDVMSEKLDKDPVVANAVVNLYGKCGQLEHARKVFDMMSDKQRVVSWNGMMALYVQHELGEEALELSKLMTAQPDELSYVTILAACGLVGDVEQGRKVHQQITERGFQTVPVVANSLLNMHSRCLRLGDAEEVFGKMERKDVISFNTMISTYTKHGRFHDALKLFPLMDIDGVRPDEITFIDVFSACCQAGLIDKAWQFFTCMVEECNMKPSEKHYGCMVDLLGRAGKLREAETFIEGMPVQAGAVVWMTLLSACRIHGDVELAERAADHAISLDPSDAGPYVALASIYRAAGMVDEAESLKGRLKEQGKWIEGTEYVENVA